MIFRSSLTTIFIRNKRWIATLVFLSQSVFAANAADEKLWAAGEVHDGDGDALLYREYHLSPADNEPPTRVEYRTDDGELFAEKTLDHSRSTTAPAIDFRDHRRGTRIVTRYPDDNDSDRLEMVYYPSGDSQPKRETFDTDSLIVDAGFDPFVQLHWERLLDGERVVAEFLVPSRNDTVRVGISAVDTDRCDTAIRELHCLEVRPAGALRMFSWFVDPIRLGYQTQPLRLMFFHGQGNIPDDSGEARQVRIQYEYAD
ncbi:MAG: hypothetical protein WEB57_14130 [Pseudohongiellaceae bacterium]